MISAVRLRQSQGILEKLRHYTEGLEGIIADLIAPQQILDNELVTTHTQGSVALIVMASNSGMCGSFNAKMIKELSKIPLLYPNEELLFFPIGKKVREALGHEGCCVQGHYDELAKNISFASASGFVDDLIHLYRSKQIKKADIFYYHYKSAATQIIMHTPLLPWSLPRHIVPTTDNENDLSIFEPSRGEILNRMMPQLIKSTFYLALADHQTAEHGARTLAMQLASENANDILEELRLNYNKLRQQTITAELLDIIGGSIVGNSFA